MNWFLFTLIPGLPLAAFLVLALAGRRMGETCGRIGTAAVGGSFLLSIAALVNVATSGPTRATVYEFLNVGNLHIEIGLYFDQLSALILPLVTGVSFIVHVYSSRYMTGDPRYRRFFAVIALFTFSMTMLVTSTNLLVTYMCWELMGICSYLLISHWAARHAAVSAATKAYLVNAAADIGLGFGIILTFKSYGTLDILEILRMAPAMNGETFELLGFSVGVNTVIATLVLVGTMGKSAQFPMHVWLPYAMEAPTPVSALIHAATMVNAGPFLLVRLSPLIVLAPSAMACIAVVGAVTAVYGALVSVVHSDIKRVLAYSTISQIGFMIFLCGVGAFSAAIFHLLAHGFLKGFLFLSAGTALEAAKHHPHAHGPRSTEGLGRLAAGSLILACIPPVVLFSGPYERLWTAHAVPSAQVAFLVVALVTVFLSSIYIFRAVAGLFGTEVGDTVRVRPPLLSGRHLPVVVVAVVAASALAVGLWNWTGTFLPAALGAGEAGDPLFPAPTAMAIAVGFAVAGWAVGMRRHVRPPEVPVTERGWAKTAYVLLLNKLYIDEIHSLLVIRPVKRFSAWMDNTIEAKILEEANRILSLRRFSNWLRHGFEERFVDGFGEVVGKVLPAAGRALSKAESSATLRPIDRSTKKAVDALEGSGHRNLQHDLLLIVCWLVAAIAIMYWLV